MSLLCLVAPLLRAGGVVDTCSDTAFEAAFDQALAGGGLVTLQCSQTNRLTATKVIRADTTIEDATGVGWLTASSTNRLFRILPGVRLTLIDLRLTAGSAAGTAGEDGTNSNDGEAGEDGLGGAIYNDGGHLEAKDVTFYGHEARGGLGGHGTDAAGLGELPTPGGRGGHAYGGAIYSTNGTVALTNCTFQLTIATGGGGGGGGSSDVFLRDGAEGGAAGEAAGGALFLAGNTQLQLIGCEFRDAEASGAPGGLGGFGDGLVHFDGPNGTSSSGRGGAIAQTGGSSVLASCIFNENIANGADGLAGPFRAVDSGDASGDPGNPGRGGAIAVEQGSMTIRNSTFSDNRADGGLGGLGGSAGGSGDGGDGGAGAPGQGAALYIEGDATVVLVDSVFTRNSVEAGFGGFGAAGVSEFSFAGKDGPAGAGEGGALHLARGLLVVDRCTFDGNSATGSEGLEGAAGNAYTPGNEGNPGGAGLGGAVFVQQGLLTVTNSTFHANTATGGIGGKGGDGGSGLAFATDGGDGGPGGSAAGGALWSHAAEAVVVVHSTFANNAVQGGEGGENGTAGDSNLAEDGSLGSPGLTFGAGIAGDAEGFAIQSTLLDSPNGAPNAQGLVADLGYNISSDATPGFDSGSTSLNNLDPLLAELANNGGPTRTMALVQGSPAIDYGQSTGTPLIDQRGLSRDPQPDPGAYESDAPAPPLQVNLNEDAVIISWPATGVDYDLESTLSLSAPSWTLTQGAVQSGGRWTITLATSSTERYFRLRQ